jgi:hypothetical protein
MVGSVWLKGGLVLGLGSWEEKRREGGDQLGYQSILVCVFVFSFRQKKKCIHKHINKRTKNKTPRLFL